MKITRAARWTLFRLILVLSQIFLSKMSFAAEPPTIVTCPHLTITGVMVDRNSARGEWATHDFAQQTRRPKLVADNCSADLFPLNHRLRNSAGQSYNTQLTCLYLSDQGRYYSYQLTTKYCRKTDARRFACFDRPYSGMPTQPAAFAPQTAAPSR
jgi:hypothetical protein